MTKLEEIEKAVQHLSSEEMKRFHDWFEELQAGLFDARIEADIKAGKLDAHFDAALSAAAAGKSIQLL